MTREQLEHVIRAAAEFADGDEIVVIGSQAILGQYPDAPAQLLVSVEADVYPRHRPERADLIDVSIGALPRPMSRSHNGPKRGPSFCRPSPRPPRGRPDRLTTPAE